MTQETSRRSFLTGLIAAPAVVAASSLMPVRSVARLLLPPSVIYVGYPMENYNFETIQAAVDFASGGTGTSVTIVLASGIYSGFRVNLGSVTLIGRESGVYMEDSPSMLRV